MTEPVAALSASLPAFTVVGLSIRTHNAEAATTIPALWGRVERELFARRPVDALTAPGGLIAVYAEYASDHTGPYTLTIGFPVPTSHVAPEGLERVVIPAADYARYEVTERAPAGIFGAWQRVWGDRSFERAFTVDLEVYPADFAAGGLPALFIAKR